jgi:trans-aconitate 2-methyltransferase
MSDWDAARYHRISDPQLAWGRAVAARLLPAAGERILDIGCGTGRLTTEIAREPGIVVVGLDRSAAMLQEARNQRPAAGSTRPPAYVRGDGAALPFVNAFDAVFSAATFHWIPDHDRLFLSIHGALKKGGRLIAQAGGAGNLERLYRRARRLMHSPTHAHFFTSWCEPCHFENVPDTEMRLRRAGFTDIDVSLHIAPVPFDEPDRYAEFVAAVCLRHQLDRLPAEERSVFIDRITKEALTDDPRLTLDYWRLNIAARKAGA